MATHRPVRVDERCSGRPDSKSVVIEHSKTAALPQSVIALKKERTNRVS
jgi:hypothetical protein